MRLNDFSVRVPEGREEAGGYVALPHGRQYSLHLRNDRPVACDAAVSIDGRHVGTWRLGPRQSARIERPVDDEGRFTFYALGSAEAGAVGLESVGDQLGLLSVEFTPARPAVASSFYPHAPYNPYLPGWYPTWRYGQRRITSNEYVPGSVTYSAGNTSDMAKGGGEGLAYASAFSSVETPPTVKSMSPQASTHAPGGTGLSGASAQQFGQAAALDLDHAQATTINLRLVVGDDGPRPLTGAQRATPVPPLPGAR